MKNVSQLLNSPGVAQKIETNPILQFDNPIISKNKIKSNRTKGILRKRASSNISCSKEMVINLKRSSIDYHKIASRSDAQLLKSDFHGSEIEVIKSRCFTLVGLSGIVVQETFSTFKIVNQSKKNSITNIIPKSSCIFLIKRNGMAQYINGDQLLCASGFRTSKKFKNKPSFYLK